MEKHPRRMVQLYSPRSEIDLLILRSLFDDADIRYYVRNDTFGSLYLGPHIEAYNRKILCVAETDLDDARALLAEFLAHTGGDSPPAPPPPRTYLERLLQRIVDRLAPRPPVPEPPRFRLIRGGRGAAGPPAVKRRPRLRLVDRP